MTERTVSIHVPAMTRVEGEGALRLHIENGKIEPLFIGRVGAVIAACCGGVTGVGAHQIDSP